MLTHYIRTLLEYLTCEQCACLICEQMLHLLFRIFTNILIKDSFSFTSLLFLFSISAMSNVRNWNMNWRDENNCFNLRFSLYHSSSFVVVCYVASSPFPSSLSYIRSSASRWYFPVFFFLESKPHGVRLPHSAPALLPSLVAFVSNRWRSLVLAYFSRFSSFLLLSFLTHSCIFELTKI